MLHISGNAALRSIDIVQSHPADPVLGEPGRNHRSKFAAAADTADAGSTDIRITYIESGKIIGLFATLVAGIFSQAVAVNDQQPRRTVGLPQILLPVMMLNLLRMEFFTEVDCDVFITHIIHPSAAAAVRPNEA